MKRNIDRGFLRVIGFLAAAFASGCSGVAPSMLETAGPAAGQIAWLSWLLWGLGGAVYVGVMAYLAVGLFRRRRQHEPPLLSGEALESERFRIALYGTGFTVVILLLVYGLTIYVLGKVSGAGQASQLTVRIDGRQWWWQVEYPQLGVVTANEIHIPVNRPVLVELRSSDVIHSFWVPQLHGKRDLIPGRVNVLWIEAKKPGVYWGECAEFCGTQHAKMQFVVVAEAEEDFQSWVEGQQQEAQIPDNPYYQRGLDVFVQSGCASCHAVRGTPAQGVTGPDLTHLASRKTIGAGILANTPGNLGGWVADPQGIKPGNHMPNLEIPAEELRTLIDFLSILD